MFKKNYKYDILIPHLDFELDFDKMTPEQTKEYFNWFLQQIPSRIKYLSFKCAEYLSLPQDKLNLSPESLILVWRWFLEVAQVGKTPKRELKRLKHALSTFPKSFRQYVVKDCSEALTIGTEYILRDIGMYIGEVFNTHYHHIKWGYYSKPKSDIFVNKPVLLGFKDTSFDPPFELVFEPIHMVGVQAANLFDKSQNEYDLLTLYEKWLKYC